MGKATGFMEYERRDPLSEEPLQRIRHFREFHVDLTEEQRRTQAARCMDCGVPFCQSGMTIGGMTSGCPLQNLVPEWNDLIYQDNMKSAYYRLISTNSFPEFTGRVCPALCEASCTCNLPASPVTVRENERSIIEWAFAHDVVKPLPKMPQTGKRVAVVGSGPSGLAAADLLNRRGYEVTVFERHDRFGGLMMYGIPNMKLEKRIVERRLDLMRREGVLFQPNTDVGREQTAQELLERFDAVVLCCGASNPRDISVPGREAKGICFAVDYLGATTRSLLDSDFQNTHSAEARGKHVLVVGGGDTGNDCVGTVIRQGAASVLQLEMMPRLPDTRAENNPWPQWPRVCKTDYGQQEAIAVFGADPRVYQTTVKEFLMDKKGRVKQAVLVKLAFEKDEATGRTAMKQVEGSEETVPADLVLIAAGFLGAQRYVADAFGVELTARGSVADSAYRTNVEKVFTAGDMRRGQSLVVWNIREGREAAAAVDRYLMGYTNL